MPGNLHLQFSYSAVKIHKKENYDKNLDECFLDVVGNLDVRSSPLHIVLKWFIQ